MILADPGREGEAALRLGRIGFDNVTGFLDGGMQAVDPRPDLLARIERITAVAPAEQLAGPNPPLVLDVRAEPDWREVTGGAGMSPGRADTGRARAPPRIVAFRSLLSFFSSNGV